MRRTRLFWQLFASYLVLVLAALVAVTWYSAYALKQSYLAEQQRDLEVAARLFASQSAADFSVEDAAALQRRCEQVAKSADMRLTVVLPDGKVLCDTDHLPSKMENHADRTEIATALSGSMISTVHRSFTEGRWMSYVAVPIKRDGQVVAAVRTAIPLSSIDQAVRDLQWNVLSGAALVAVVVGLLGFLIARWISRPLEQLRDDARALVHNHHGQKIPLPDGDEMAGIADACNQMAQQLEERSHTIGRKGHEQQAVLASMVEGVLAVDSEERVISLNRAAAELIGGHQGDLFGRSLQEVIRNADLRRFANRALVCDEPIEDDVVMHGDANRVLRARGTALRDVRGQGVGAVIVLNDVTHFRHLENLRRDFVANVSHELKTPIASIKGFVETLLDGAINSPEDADRFLRIVAKQADRLNSIIEDLLSLSKIEQSEEAADLPLERGRVHEVLDAAISDCEAHSLERHIRITVDCPAELEALMNPPLLEQAIINLIDNAIKYSEPDSEVNITAAPVLDEVTIAVVDHGCGIEKEHLPRLFERFYRVDKARSRKLGGTGLGLAIVKHIVQAHHGRITVRSQPGKGSEFTIHLPIRAI